MAESIQLTVVRGTTFSYAVQWRDEAESPVDMTGATAKMGVRSTDDSDPPLLTLTTGDGISLSSNGFIAFEMTPAQSSRLVGTRAVADVLIDLSTGERYRPVVFEFTLEGLITRS